MGDWIAAQPPPDPLVAAAPGLQVHVRLPTRASASITAPLSKRLEPVIVSLARIGLGQLMQQALDLAVAWAIIVAVSVRRAVEAEVALAFLLIRKLLKFTEALAVQLRFRWNSALLTHATDPTTLTNQTRPHERQVT